MRQYRLCSKVEDSERFLVACRRPTTDSTFVYHPPPAGECWSYAIHNSIGVIQDGQHNKHALVRPVLCLVLARTNNSIVVASIVLYCHTTV